MLKDYSDNVEAFDIALKHNLYDNILEFTAFDIPTFIKKNYIEYILKNFDEPIIFHIFTNTKDPIDVDTLYTILKKCVFTTVVKKVIDMLPDVNIVDRYGDTILHIICSRYYFNAGLVLHSLSKGLVLNKKNNFGVYPFELSFSKYNNHSNSLETFKYYEKFYDSDEISKSKTFIKNICKYSTNGSLLIYVMDKYDINFKKLLNTIVGNQSFNTIKEILEKNPQYNNLRDVYNISVIVTKRFCYHADGLEIIKYFVSKNMNLLSYESLSGSSTLSLVCSLMGNFDVFKYYLDYYISNNHDINSENNYGYTPLAYLMCRRQTQQVHKCLMYMVSIPECKKGYMKAFKCDFFEAIHRFEYDTNKANKLESLAKSNSKKMGIFDDTKATNWYAMLLYVLIFVFFFYMLS